jgi:hypothetical protein
VRLERLTRGHVLAAVAALALLLTMALDWYGSREGDAAQQVLQNSNPSGAQGGEVGRELQADAKAIIAREEKNAWQADEPVDRVLLAFLLLSVILPLAAAALRSEGRRFEPPWTPSSLSAIAATIAALLIAYRLIQEPGVDAETNIKLGLPLALLCLAGVALGSASAFQKEVNWSTMRQAASAQRTPSTAA